MSACANKPSTPRSAPTKRSCLTSHGCWRGPTTARATTARVKRAFGNERDQVPRCRPKIGGTEITRFNALRHGVLSRYTVLPWEDAAEYRDLVASLVAEHALPQGRLREHLVEELTGILGASALALGLRPPPTGTDLKMRFRDRTASFLALAYPGRLVSLHAVVPLRVYAA